MSNATQELIGPKGVFVSLQAPDHGHDLVRGHRASGVLVDRDLVIVPQLAQKLIPECGGYEVLLVPMPVPTAGPAEVAQVSSVEVHAVKGAKKRTMFGVLRLASPTSLPVVNGAEPTPIELALKVAKEGGTMWPTLVPGKDGMRFFRPSPARVLSQVVETEALGRGPGVKMITYRTPNDFALSWCSVVPWCEPGGSGLPLPPDVHVDWL
jgi:hypothetical protein